MAIRKSMHEEMVVAGTREEWLQKCTKALESQDFTKVIKNEILSRFKEGLK